MSVQRHRRHLPPENYERYTVLKYFIYTRKSRATTTSMAVLTFNIFPVVGGVNLGRVQRYWGKLNKNLSERKIR